MPAQDYTFVQRYRLFLIHFDDIKVGLVVLLPSGRGETVEYGRFTGRRVLPGSVPSEN